MVFLWNYFELNAIFESIYPSGTQQLQFKNPTYISSKKILRKMCLETKTNEKNIGIYKLYAGPTQCGSEIATRIVLKLFGGRQNDRD